MADNELETNSSSSGEEEEESSGSESSDSASDSDSGSPSKNPVNSDPISSKPEKAVKNKSETSQSAKRTALAAPATKKDSKKAKTNDTKVDDDSKKALIQRIWSEEDEVLILQGMIDYETGENPSGNMIAFHEFIKKSIHVNVSKAQLVRKIRRLKLKFFNTLGRNKNRKDPRFCNTHEQKIYELSKSIWGTDDSKNNGNVNAASPSASASASVIAGTSSGVKSNRLEGVIAGTSSGVKSNRLEGSIMGMEICDGPVLTEEIMNVEMEKKWKDLKKQELELFMKKLDMLKLQVVKLLEAID